MAPTVEKSNHRGVEFRNRTTTRRSHERLSSENLPRLPKSGNQTKRSVVKDLPGVCNQWFRENILAKSYKHLDERNFDEDLDDTLSRNGKRLHQTCDSETLEAREPLKEGKSSEIGSTRNLRRASGDDIGDPTTSSSSKASSSGARGETSKQRKASHEIVQAPSKDSLNRSLRFQSDTNSRQDLCSTRYSEADEASTNIEIDTWSLQRHAQKPRTSKRISRGLAEVRRATKLALKNNKGLVTESEDGSRLRDAQDDSGDLHNYCRQSSDPCEYCSSLWINNQQANAMSSPIQGKLKASRMLWLRKAVQTVLPYKAQTISNKKNYEMLGSKHNDRGRFRDSLLSHVSRFKYGQLDGQAGSVYNGVEQESYLPPTNTRPSKLFFNAKAVSPPATGDLSTALRRPLSTAVSLPVIREGSCSLEEFASETVSKPLPHRHRRFSSLSSLRQLSLRDNRCLENGKGAIFQSAESRDPSFIRSDKNSSTEPAEQDHFLSVRDRKEVVKSKSFDSSANQSRVGLYSSTHKNTRNTSVSRRLSKSWTSGNRSDQQNLASSTSSSLRSSSLVTPHTSRFREEFPGNSEYLQVPTIGNRKGTIRDTLHRKSLEGDGYQYIDQRNPRQGSILGPEGKEDASEVWERALEDYTLQTSAQSGGSSIFDFGRRSVSPGSLWTRSARGRSRQNFPIQGISEASSRSSVRSLSPSSQAYKGGTNSARQLLGKKCANDSPKGGCISPSWEKYPSHTRAERTLSAGAADRVSTYDFGAQIEASSNSCQEQTNTSTFSKGFYHRTTMFYRQNIGDLRRLGKGNKSSISAGGNVDFPDLELLPKMLPALVEYVPRKTAFGESSKTIPTAPNAQITERPAGPQFDQSPHSLVDLAKKHPDTMPRSARAWSQIYEDCVQHPYDKASDGSGAILERTLLQPPLSCNSSASQYSPSKAFVSSRYGFKMRNSDSLDS